MSVPAGGGEQISRCSCYCINHSLNKAENNGPDYFCSWDSLHSHNVLASWNPHKVPDRRQSTVTVFMLFSTPEVSFVDLNKGEYSFCKVKNIYIFRYRCLKTRYVEWSTSSINLAHWPGIGLPVQNFSLPWFLITIYISLCSKIRFKCKHAYCPLSNFISAK